MHCKQPFIVHSSPNYPFFASQLDNEEPDEFALPSSDCLSRFTSRPNDSSSLPLHQVIKNHISMNNLFKFDFELSSTHFVCFSLFSVFIFTLTAINHELVITHINYSSHPCHSLYLFDFFGFCFSRFLAGPFRGTLIMRREKKETRKFTRANLYSFINMRHNTAVILTFSLISFKYDWWYVLVTKQLPGAVREEGTETRGKSFFAPLLRDDDVEWRFSGGGRLNVSRGFESINETLFADRA